jgi:competence ComEA-like helix-hairpin-helix protein
LNDSKNVLSGDGRLTVVLCFMFGLLLLDLTFCYHWPLLESKSACISCEQLSFVHPNTLIIENYSETDRKPEPRLFPANVTPFFFTLIPINSADKNLLLTVKGIGPALADDIIEYRDKNGPFKQYSDLKKLKGIGAKRATAFAAAFTFTEVP